MKNIVVIGSGFAGCTAIRTLRAKGYKDRITLISPKPELFYYPSLIWVANGKRCEPDLRINLEAFFNRHQVDYLSGHVTGLDIKNNLVTTDNNSALYDYLVIASGGRYIRKLPGIEHAHIACSGWQATHEWADKLNSMKQGILAFGFAGNPKEPSAMRGGPVFEFMFGTETLLRNRGMREKFQLHFFSPAPKPGARMGEKAVERLLAEMSKRGITTHLGHKMKALQANKVITETEEFETDLTLFIPGMTGPAWADKSGLALSDGGFFLADEYCQAEGADNIYVAGDAGSFPGPEWKPKQAHMADLQAEAAAKNIINKLDGKKSHHTFKTELICIVDTLNTGTLVYRGQHRALQLKGKPLHWAKKLFEWNYLRPYRQ